MNNSEKLYLIYKHTSPSGKSYIGQTNDYIRRCYEHQNMNGSSRVFHYAINKYDWNNFIHVILEENLTLEEANIFEEYYIEFYNTLSPNGYNLQSGGLNYITSEETKQKMSEVRSGLHHTEETLKK